MQDASFRLFGDAFSVRPGNRLKSDCVESGNLQMFTVRRIKRLRSAKIPIKGKTEYTSSARGERKDIPANLIIISQHFQDGEVRTHRYA